MAEYTREQLAKLTDYWTVGDCGTDPIPAYITVRNSGGTSRDGVYVFTYDGEVNGKPSWIAASSNLEYTGVAGLTGQWQMNIAGAVVQYGVEDTAIPQEGSWPPFGATGTTVLEYGNTTAYNLLVDDDTGETLQDADTGHWLGELK